MAKVAEIRKRLKHIKSEMEATKQKVVALKTERAELKIRLQAQKDAAAAK